MTTKRWGLAASCLAWIMGAAPATAAAPTSAPFGTAADGRPVT